MTTDEKLLLEIRDSLGDLPERMASVLGKIPMGQGGSSGEGEGGKGKDKWANWKKRERLLSAGGQFLPMLGGIANQMRNFRELSDAWGSMGKQKSAKVKTTDEEAKALGFPGFSTPARKTMLAGGAGRLTQLSPQSEQASLQSAIEQLAAAVQQMASHAAQGDPEMANDAEQVPEGPSGQSWMGGGQGGGGGPAPASPEPQQQAPRDSMRPQQKPLSVPQAKDTTGKPGNVKATIK